MELIDQKVTEIRMFKTQTIVMQDETLKYRDYLQEAEMELQVLPTLYLL